MTEEERFQKRIMELAQKAYDRGYYTYTHFLGMNEQTLFYQAAPRFSWIPYTLYGGYEYSERCIAAFGSEQMFGYPPAYPIACLAVEPLHEKFAEELTHRDFLGSLMNLGIKREMLGDLFIREKKAYLYCVDSIADYITETLVRVRHTPVSAARVEQLPDDVGRDLEQQIITVASDRLDAVVAAVYRLSRNQALDLFRGKKIFVNGKLRENNSQAAGAGDVISVRGHGKFLYDGPVSVTRKDRLRVSVRIFR